MSGFIAETLGFFLLMLIFMGVAIRTQKKKWFTIGAVFQFMSIVGIMLEPIDSLAKIKIIIYLIIYIAILLITAFVMKRRNKNNNNKL